MKTKPHFPFGVIVSALFFVAFSPVFAETQQGDDSEKPLCSLQSRVFDMDGNEFQTASPGIQVHVTLWQKIKADESVHGTNWNPVVHSPDGTSWRQIGEYYLGDPGWTTQWPVKKDVSPGEYRFSFTIHKIFTTWEGPPGTSGSSSGAYHGRVTNVDGYAAPKRVFGWGLSDVIAIENGDTEKTVELRPDDGPKVRLQTTFFPDPATVSETDATPDSEKEVLPQRYRKAAEISMQIFRADYFPMDQHAGSNSYGIPWHVDFDHMKPGLYYVHFFRGTPYPETAVTATTDVFTFNVTEDGPNDFVFTPEKSLAENAPWQIVGTVRDENGDSLPNVTVSLGSQMYRNYHEPLSFGEYIYATTDDEGKYRIVVSPSNAFSGAVFDAEANRWRWGFRLQQATIQATRSYDDISPTVFESALVFPGEFASDELKKQLAERNGVFPVAMNEPAVVDFVLSPQGKVFSWEQWLERDNDPERRKLRFEILERRKTFEDSDAVKLFCEIVLPNSLNEDYIAAMAIASKISTTLTAEKPAFMLDEPIELNWNITNGSDYDVSVMIDENMGVPTIVWAVSEEGDIFLEKERWGWDHSGPVHYRRIVPEGTFPYEIFLPEKFAITKPGRYTINVARDLMVKRIKPVTGDRDYELWMPSEHWPEVSMPVFASITIDVVPTDPIELGKHIEELVATFRERGTREKYQESGKAWKTLCAINDERVVPYLVEEIRDAPYGPASSAVSALSKFECDEAFEGIKKALTLSDHNLLIVAASALVDSKHPDAMAELLNHQEHPDYSVRLRVVQAAEKMDRETALEMLRKRFNDPGWEGNVGKEARRIYDKMTGQEATD